jgi:hypothetical protein
MPRGKYYSPEVRKDAQQLRREGRSLREISEELGIPRNTLSLWLRDIELAPDQHKRLRDKRFRAGFANEHSRFVAAEWHHRRKRDRIEGEHRKAEDLLNSLQQPVHANHIAAAMLYLGEGSKGKDVFAFANSNPDIIRYWLYLLRTSFAIDESKFRLRIMIRADQDRAETRDYWMNVTNIGKCMPVFTDLRSVGKSPTYSGYNGVCTIYYNDISIRRYLDAVAHGLMARATGLTQ